MPGAGAQSLQREKTQGSSPIPLTGFKVQARHPSAYSVFVCFEHSTMMPPDASQTVSLFSFLRRASGPLPAHLPPLATLLLPGADVPCLTSLYISAENSLFPRGSEEYL